jgi:hypothetical protein
MISIKITYEGKSYDSITDAFQKAAENGIKKMITDKLLPFNSEIQQANGIVEINVSDNLKDMNIKLKNIPQDLIDRITAALK